MAESSNTAVDISKIKESLGREVVPAVTGKPSRVIKYQKPRRSPKKVTAGGASLYEIAEAIQEDPTITLGQAIRQGKKEAKERDAQEHKGAKDFFTGALGHGLGNAIASFFDTKEQKKAKKLAEAERKYEEGNKFKADFLKSLLGEKIGGMLARNTTLTSTKISAFEKYQELMNSYKPTPKSKPAKPPKPPKPIKPKAPKVVKPKSSPQREEAHKALMALGYNKTEASERLSGAPENSSVEELIKHGLNPTVKSITKPEAVASAQTQAAELGKEEDK